MILPNGMHFIGPTKLPEKQPTASVDLELTEVSLVSRRKLHDEISVRRQAAGTLQGDCSSSTDGARVLATA